MGLNEGQEQGHRIDYGSSLCEHMPMDEYVDRLTPVSREVLKLAQQEATRLRHSEVAPEHLLIALASHSRSRSLAMLRELNANLSRLQQGARKTLGPARLTPFQSVGDSVRTRRVLDLAHAEASTFGSREIGTDYLLLGLIREGGASKDILANEGVSLYGVHKLLRSFDFRDGDQLPAVDLSRAPIMRSPAARAIRSLPIRPSRVFLGIVGITTLTGLFAYLNLPLPQIPVFLFVLGGWVISVCFHEFGHAAVAYIGGDTTVVNKGYLTLNPLKYTHRLLSIIFPIIFLILGGIPLPGGAVYVDRSVIRSRRMLSWLSAAGITAQAILILVLLIPYHLASLISSTAVAAHANFWGAYSLIIYLNLLGIVINLLPIPGIDGYGIIEPYLPFRITSWAERIRPYGFMILFIVLWLPNPISALIFFIAVGVSTLLGVDFGLVGLGFSLFRFWR